MPESIINEYESKTEISKKIKPTFDNVYEYLIKPLKNVILLEDPSAILQIEEQKSKRCSIEIQLKLMGSHESAKLLSQIDPDYIWNGKYYLYIFKCNKLIVYEKIESFDKRISILDIS